MAEPIVVVKKRRALPFFHRHPWVYSSAIKRVDDAATPGCAVSLCTEQGEFIAYGLYNPDSNITVRLYSWDISQPLDEQFWSTRLDLAISARKQLAERIEFGAENSAYRLCFSEADGLSGLTVDRYADWLVMQVTSRAIADRLSVITRLLQEKLHPAGIWLRTEKGMRESENLVIADGPVFGEQQPEPFEIKEQGVCYQVDIVTGHKTGFYLDQRDNRQAITKYVSGHRILDLFCYTGSLGISAIVSGNAESVLAVDQSEAAIKIAHTNALRNQADEKIQFEQSKAFDVLERLVGANEKFDTVILDPPKMARRRANLANAMRGYHSLNRLAVDVLRPGGVLVTCCCSGLVEPEDFERMLADVALATDRRIQILERRGQPPDHPTSVFCPETRYLKCLICRVE